MAVDMLRSSALANLVNMKDASGYLGKIKKLNETLDQGVTLDDLMAMWDLSSDVMMILDRDKVIHINNAISVMGYDRDDWHHKSILDFCAPNDKARLLKCLEHQEKASKCRCKIRTKTGAEVLIEISISVTKQDRRYAICRIL